MLSCTSFAQTAPVPSTDQAQPTAPAQETSPTQQAVPVQETSPVQQAAPVQQAVAGGESAKPEAARPEAESQASTPLPAPAASTPSTEAAAATAGDVPAAPAAPIAPLFAQAPFVPGAKLFIEPMNGFELRLSDAILKKKVPVVVVSERAKADFVLSGGAHVHKRNFFTGMVLSTNGKGSVSIEDAHTGNQVFAYKFSRVDANTTVDQSYQNWADACAKRLKKTLEKK
jgi:hypothetical protein